MTRPCECGLALRPERLFGFRMEPADGAPCSRTGSITREMVGLPSADSLASFGAAGKEEIQEDRVIMTKQASPKYAPEVRKHAVRSCNNRC